MKKQTLIKTSAVVTIACIMLFLFGFWHYSSQADPPAQIKSVTELEDYLKSLTNQKSPPGLSVIVVKGEEVVYSNGFGYADLPENKKATPNTGYQWWSMTKPFTVTAILQLQEKGLLNIDDPVKKYLSFFEVKRPKEASNKITIRQLLSHSAGLGDIGMEILGWIHYKHDRSFNQTELVKSQLPKHRNLKASPGIQGRYSNLGYMLLAAIIEKVSGQSYDKYIQDHILNPLRMKHTGFSYTPEMIEMAAAGTHPRDFMSLLAFTMIEKQKAVREKKDGIYWFNSIYADQQGSTGLIGSTKDLSHFMIAMLNEGEWNGQRILSQESIKMMQIPQIKVGKSPAQGIDELQFGLGWFIHDDNGRKALSHGGNGAAFVAQMRLYPDEELGVAVMANSTYLEKMGGTIISDLASFDW